MTKDQTGCLDLYLKTNFLKVLEIFREVIIGSKTDIKSKYKLT